MSEKIIQYVVDNNVSKPVSSISIVNEDGTNEVTPSRVSGIEDKIGDLSGQGITEGEVAKAIKNDRVVMSNNTNQINDINTKMGNLSNLTTDNKIDLVQALNEHELQINSNTSQLADKQTQIKNIQVPYNYQGAVVTFVDDDISASFLTNAKPIFDSKGVKASLGVVSSFVGTSTYMTLAQLLDLQNQGFEMICHSKTHTASVFRDNLASVTDAAIETEYKDSQQWMKDSGLLGYNTFVYPWGNFGDQAVRYKRLARKYYNYALNASGVHNTSPVDNMYMNRYQLLASNDFNTVVKPVLDNVITANGWLVILTHSWDSTNFSATLLGQVIDYLKTNNIPIMTFSDAEKLKGNAISVGEFSDTSKSVYIAKDGNKSGFISGIGVNVLPYSSSNLMTDSILTYPYGITTKPINNTNDVVTSQGGTMTISRNSSSDDYSFATFNPYNNNDLYISHWDSRATTPNWKAWTKINVTQSFGTVATTQTGFALSTSLSNAVCKDGRLVGGTISLSNATQNGNIAQNDILATFDKAFAPQYPVFIKLTVLTSTGTYLDAYASIEWSSTATILKSQTTISTNNIKWIIADFSFVSNT